MEIRFSVFAIKETIENVETCKLCGEPIYSDKFTVCLKMNNQKITEGDSVCESCSDVFSENGIEVYG